MQQPVALLAIKVYRGANKLLGRDNRAFSIAALLRCLGFKQIKRKHSEKGPAKVLKRCKSVFREVWCAKAFLNQVANLNINGDDRVTSLGYSWEYSAFASHDTAFSGKEFFL